MPSGHYYNIINSHPPFAKGGFGTFAKVRRKARKRRNPQTGELIENSSREGKKVVYELDEKEFPVEMRFKAAVRTLNQYICAYNFALYEKFGEEGLKLIAEVWSDMAGKFFPESFEKMGLKGNGPKEIAEWFAKSDAIIGYDSDFFILSDKKAGFRVNNCPWYKSPSPVGGRICSEGVIAFERKAAQLLNPKIKVSMGKFFHNGDDCCEYIFELPEE